MARKSHTDALGVTGAETIIGTSVVVQGLLESASDITIDGQLNGTITTSGDITIGVNARIKANVTGANVTVAGHLKGNIQASGEAFIRETGQVEGDITAGSIAINPGGIFIGRSQMPTNPLANPNDQPDDATKLDR